MPVANSRGLAIFRYPPKYSDRPTPRLQTAPVGQRTDTLARLALDSAGAVTARSNDAGLAVARALNRMDCTYALAIRDDDPRDDRRKSVEIWMKRPGLKAIHAIGYTLRSGAERRESVLRAAYLAPAIYDDGSVRGALIPLRPSSRSRWAAEVAVSFPAAGAGAKAQDAEVGIMLRRGATVVHEARRNVRLEAAGEGTSPRRIIVIEQVELPPGTYSLSAVLAGPGRAAPRSVAVEAAVPELPRDGWFLIGPLLGRRAEGDVVMRSGDEPGGFQPLIEPVLNTPADVVAVTQVCAARGSGAGPEPLVARALRSGSGEMLGEMDPVRVRVEDRGDVRCASLVDELPAEILKPGGTYVFEVSFVDAAAGAKRSARVEIARGGP